MHQSILCRFEVNHIKFQKQGYWIHDYLVHAFLQKYPAYAPMKPGIKARNAP